MEDIDKKQIIDIFFEKFEETDDEETETETETEDEPEDEQKEETEHLDANALCAGAHSDANALCAGAFQDPEIVCKVNYLLDDEIKIQNNLTMKGMLMEELVNILCVQDVLKLREPLEATLLEKVIEENLLVQDVNINNFSVVIKKIFDEQLLNHLWWKYLYGSGSLAVCVLGLHTQAKKILTQNAIDSIICNVKKVYLKIYERTNPLHALLKNKREMRDYEKNYLKDLKI